MIKLAQVEFLSLVIKRILKNVDSVENYIERLLFYRLVISYTKVPNHISCLSNLILAYGNN